MKYLLFLTILVTACTINQIEITRTYNVFNEGGSQTITLEGIEVEKDVPVTSEQIQDTEVKPVVPGWDTDLPYYRGFE